MLLLSLIKTWVLARLYISHCGLKERGKTSTPCTLTSLVFVTGIQALQQQQRYERESSLFQIDCSRKILLSKLKEYKGDNLEVIHEALTFAGGTLDHDDDLLPPPDPSHLPDLFVMMDDPYPSPHFTSKYKFTRNGVNGEEAKKSMNGSDEKQWSQPTNRNKPQGIRLVFGLLAKSVLTFVGVVSVLSLAGFKPMLRRDGTQFKIQELFRKPACEERQSQVECPSGKVLVIEEGQPRCLVKERVEIPFDLDVSAPKINYGFG